MSYFDDCATWKIVDEHLAVVAGADAGGGLSCRVYRTPDRSVLVEQRRAALTVGIRTER